VCYTRSVNVGRQIRRLREERGWSQEQLAIQARRFAPTHGLARETISRIENGHRPPDMWVVEACASALGVTPDVLFSEDAPPAPVRSSAQLFINEAQPAYAPLTREVAQLAARLNRLPAAPRAKIVAAFAAVVELTEGQPLSEELAAAAAEAPSAASPEPDPAQRSRTARLIRLLDQLADEEYQQVVGEIDALLAATAATASPAPAPERRVAGTRSGG
jgi:transcriptional regulator with XRE-family HTH domain